MVKRFYGPQRTLVANALNFSGFINRTSQQSRFLYPLKMQFSSFARSILEYGYPVSRTLLLPRLASEHVRLVASSLNIAHPLLVRLYQGFQRPKKSHNMLLKIIKFRKIIEKFGNIQNINYIKIISILIFYIAAYVSEQGKTICNNIKIPSTLHNYHSTFLTTDTSRTFYSQPIFLCAF